MDVGDHLSVFRLGYWHHGIYVGDRNVIHFTGTPLNIHEAEVRLDDLEEFAGANSVEVVQYRGVECFAPAKVVDRARGRLGRPRYVLAHMSAVRTKSGYDPHALDLWRLRKAVV